MKSSIKRHRQLSDGSTCFKIYEKQRSLATKTSNFPDNNYELENQNDSNYFGFSWE